MIDWLETFKVAGPIVGSLVGGGGVWAYFTQKMKNKANIASSQADLGKMLTEHTGLLIREHRNERRALKREMIKQGMELRLVHLKVEECTQKHRECEETVMGLREEIQLLLSGPVATYPNKGASHAD